MSFEPAPRFIFLDPRGHRWPRFRRLAFWSALALALAGVLFVAAVWIRPVLRLPAIVRELKGRLKEEASAPPVRHAWGRTPVIATVDGHQWRTSVWRERSGRTLLPVPKSARGTKGHGDEVEVRLEFTL